MKLNVQWLIVLACLMPSYGFKVNFVEIGNPIGCSLNERRIFVSDVTFIQAILRLSL